MKNSLTAFFSFVFLVSGYAVYSGNSVAESSDSQKTESLKLFDQAARVFQHPRCLNCHPGGDQPTQGKDMHTHIMNIQRGKANHGAVGAQCATCHGDKNNTSSGVPGAPKWGIAPKDFGWQGLTKSELCKKLKGDFPKGKFTGGMTSEEFIHHNGEDKLVGWGWNPGEGREPVPYTQKQFGQIVARWIQTGAECPVN